MSATLVPIAPYKATQDYLKRLETLKELRKQSKLTLRTAGEYDAAMTSQEVWEDWCRRHDVRSWS